MTETYNGAWDPVRGDVPKEKVQDAYHKYPVGKVEGIFNGSVSGAFQVRSQETSTPAVNAE